MNDTVPPNRENVVRLTERRQVTAPSLARLPAAMHGVRDRARQALQGRLGVLFDEADDALFELADQANNNQEQNLYFDSMREVRLQRRSIEQAFFQRLDSHFAALLNPQAERLGQTEDQREDRVSPDELALVQNDELEQLVATETMVNKANSQFAESLQHLTLRMDQLVPVKVYQQNNPLGADAICNGFSEASRGLKIDVKAKLVLFKLFDKVLVGRLGELYQSLNQQLIEASILPSLKVGAPATSRASRPKPSARAERNLRNDETDQVLHTLRSLLSDERSERGSREESGQALDSHELMGLLSRVQQSAPTGDMAPVDVSQLLRHMKQGEAARSLNRVDEDVINLVSMMFEFILDDRNLAAPMKALLGRLQIPLIKVAIVDKSFFSRGGHPARRLLNELAMAALGWQDPGEERRSRDPLYRKVEEVVQQLLSEFESDVGIFERMLLDFRAYLEKERRRARILEQRTLDAEDGKARAERARAQVDAALAARTQGLVLAPAAQRLLEEAWAKVLFIVALKQGTSSKDWDETLETAEQLIWSVTASMNKENRRTLLKLVPMLLPRLRSGLESIAYNPFEMNQLFKQLEQLHLSRLREVGESTVLQEAEPEEVMAEGVQEVSPPRSQSPSKLASEPVAAQTQAESAPPSEQPSAEAPVSASTPELPTSDPHLALVANLSQGTWFEVQTSEDQVFRCRLAAIIKPTGKYIFVNRAGMKVAEETRESLAKSLKAGDMRLLDDSMLFDRALEAVIGNLRSARNL